MQQTQKYKLNKPGKDDTFSVDPLNENMDKLEAALTTEAAAREAADSGLEQRMIKLENCRIIVGRYRGSGGAERIIDLGERPLAVLVSHYSVNGQHICMAFGDTVCISSSSKSILKLVDNGFWVSNIFNVNYPTGYSFVAFLGGWPAREFPKEDT